MINSFFLLTYLRGCRCFNVTLIITVTEIYSKTPARTIGRLASPIFHERGQFAARVGHACNPKNNYAISKLTPQLWEERKMNSGLMLQLSDNGKSLAVMLALWQAKTARVPAAPATSTALRCGLSSYNIMYSVVKYKATRQ